MILRHCKHTPRWASQAAGRYYQKHAFENRVNIMILHSTVNRPLFSKHYKSGPMDVPVQWMDKPSYRDAKTHLD